MREPTRDDVRQAFMDAGWAPVASPDSPDWQHGGYWLARRGRKLFVGGSGEGFICPDAGCQSNPTVMTRESMTPRPVGDWHSLKKLLDELSSPDTEEAWVESQGEDYSFWSRAMWTGASEGGQGFRDIITAWWITLQYHERIKLEDAPAWLKEAP
jgi:hypothetical protein